MDYETTLAEILAQLSYIVSNPQDETSIAIANSVIQLANVVQNIVTELEL